MNDRKVRLAIYGAGGMGRELADIAQRLIAAKAFWSDMVIVDDDASLQVPNHIVVTPSSLNERDRLCFAVGDPQIRRRLAERFRSLPIASVRSATSIVAPSAEIGDGAMLCDYVVINNNARVGRHFLANVFSQVSHDCVIGDFVTFSPRVSCNGNVHIGDGVFVGAGAVIRNGSPNRPLHIGAGATIGMGAVVIGDVSPGAEVVGVPAK